MNSDFESLGSIPLHMTNSGLEELGKQLPQGHILWTEKWDCGMTKLLNLLEKNSP